MTYEHKGLKGAQSAETQRRKKDLSKHAAKISLQKLGFLRLRGSASLR